MGLDQCSGEPGQAGRFLLCLGQERERDEGIGGEEVERRRTVVGLLEGPVERGRAGLRQRFGDPRPGGNCGRIFGYALPKRLRSPGGAALEPNAQWGRCRAWRVHPPLPSQAEMTAGVWARASANRAGSPAPADAKWGRPPPLPPLIAAIRFTRSPALRPALTRSSLNVT